MLRPEPSHVTQTVDEPSVCHCLPRENEPFEQGQHCLRLSQIERVSGKQCRDVASACHSSCTSSGTRFPIVRLQFEDVRAARSCERFRLPFSGRACPAPKYGARNGMVLIIVVVVVLMVSLAGLSYVSWMHTEHKAVHVHGDELLVGQVAASGEELLKTFVEQSPQARHAAGGCWDNPDLFRGVLVLDGERTGRRGRFSVIAPRIEDGQISGVRFGAENESARLNLAVLPDWERQNRGAGRAALMNLPGMTESIADAVLDWIDADDAPRQFGAEADYYAGLDVPYGPRNAVPECLEELLLVRGVTRGLLFGGDENFNYQLEAEETKNAAGLGSIRAGTGLPWATLLTVCSGERNLNPEGKPRIELNDTDLPKLHGRLAGVLDERQAEFIIAYRQFGPYKGKKEASPEAAFRLDLSLPAQHKISSVLDLVGANVRTPRKNDPKRPILEGPFRDDPAAMREYLPKLLDHTTLVKAKVIRGRINVNRAPRAVLRAVPELEQGVVEQIIAARGPQDGPDDPNRRHATWLLTEGLVELKQMKALMPYLTGGGDVYRAQIVGYFDRPGPSARVEIVVDATGTQPRQVYWKDLRLLGRGYSPELLGAEPPAQSRDRWSR